MASRLADSSFLFMGPQQRPIKPHRFQPLKSPGLYYLKWKSLPPTRIKHQRCLIPLRRITTVRAVAVPVAPSPADSSPTPAESAEYRKQLSESYGFKQIGEPLPENVALKDIVATLPKKVFEIDDVKAWKSVLISVTSYALGLFMISKAAWYLLPLAWAWTGDCNHRGHDCAHKSFSKNKLVEDIVGTLAFLPLIYPYEPWRFKHDQHHAKTNMLSEDTAWHPVWREEFDSSPVLRNAIVYGYGPLRPWMLMWHFDVKKFRPNEVKRVKISLACVIAFMAIGWPLIIYKTGIMGWIKFWLMPWLGYHFWMSTFTMVHHTAPHIPFKYSDEWNAAQAQLNGTVHCDYPRWIEILCHHINVHIPHHISPRIPSYNLLAAHQSLRENWGKYLNEATWNWRLMKTILTTCHVYNKEQNYIAFDELAPEESYPITILKKVMPDYA
ncbi:hypothetical protein HYC85_017161 [Camellia sinensis]|uniref:Fatty acid desaturase domain-containing protein n=1 Tax=Camellia sinensis TaxID=4442 RepID=A0A7J7H1T9_CAMSI|nr:hypothetical protein HYC85_017161 [Camellia sinensis]